MFGNNPIRKPEKGDGTQLAVQKIFPTFQGEGPYTGWPAIFIRLGGCNLACKFCDTEFETFTYQSLDTILATITTLNSSNHYKLIVITGGEPLRQPIELLCTTLSKQNYTVQIETNGTLWRDIAKTSKIICSPKNTGKGYYPIRNDLLPSIHAFKFLISAHNKNYTNVPDLGQDEYNIPVYVQPMDEYDPKKNYKNIQQTLHIANQYGYRISLQMHKILDIE